MNNFDNLKNKTAAVVLNGEKYNGKIDGDIIVGVDGGCDITERVDIFVGDKDSVQNEVKCRKQILLNVEKDETDGEPAVKYLVEKGCRKINFYGVTGGRLDHILANLSIMALSVQNGCQVVAYCNDCEIYMTNSQLSLKIPQFSTISLVPFTDEVHIISLEGVKWQIFDEIICKNSSRTISNISSSDNIRLCVDFGIVMLIVNKWFFSYY